jgi:ATP-dependent DNA ligase
MPLPKWIKPQLTRLVEEAPAGDDWLHEIKYDGYRMHARIDGGHAQLLTPSLSVSTAAA